MVKVGLCGFTMPVTEYFETFRTVEVNQTFYDPPDPRQLAGWRARAGRGFEFVVKAWQVITHELTSGTYRRLRRPLAASDLAGAGSFKPTGIVTRGWETTLECARILRADKVLVQCPPGFAPTVENLDAMRRFFGTATRPPLLRVLWEPRGEGWTDAIVRSICDELDLDHAADPFLRPVVTPRLRYLRLHGGPRYAHSFDDAELRGLAAGLEPDRETYVMFNNVPCIANARRFLAIVRGARSG
jgi:uncharacterized protein YecE (DUF72 family)